MTSVFDLSAPVAEAIGDGSNKLASLMNAADLDRVEAPPPIQSMAKLLGAAGLLGLSIDAAKGGRGKGVLGAIHALEVVGRRWPFLLDPLFFGNFSIARVIAEAASDECRARLLSPLLRGDAILPMAITEPEAGAAAADLATVATAEGDGFTVTGEKRFVSYLSEARSVALAVRFGVGPETIGVVVVPTSASGLEVGPTQRFIGGETWCGMSLRSVRVAADGVVLSGGLFTRWAGLFDCDKLGTSARALALALHCFDAAKTYAAERQQFGRRLCEFQSVQTKFGEMDAYINAARMILHKAAIAADQGASIGYEAATAKLLCGDAALFACGEAAQIMGATGVSSLSKVEYCLRKVQGLTITSGTSELLKVKLAETIFGQRFPQAIQRV